MMRTLTIDRSKWYRGHGSDLSRLLTTTETKTHAFSELPQNKIIDPTLAGKMCCLGFACLDADLAPEDIADRPFPGELDEEADNQLLTHPVYHWLVIDTGDDDSTGPCTTSRLSDEIGHVNDDPTISDEQRERLLSAKFAELGIQLEFIN